MNNKNETKLPTVTCPSCNQPSTELEWNMFTSEFKKGLEGNGGHPIRFYSQRKEGTFFRCPICKDELITVSCKMLRVQGENGKPVFE